MYEVLKKNGLMLNLLEILDIHLYLQKYKKKSIFVIEASSYQLDYSQLFTSKYAVILNISPDHLERHKTLKNYIMLNLN